MGGTVGADFPLKLPLRRVGDSYREPLEVVMCKHYFLGEWYLHSYRHISNLITLCRLKIMTVKIVVRVSLGHPRELLSSNVCDNGIVNL